MKRTFSTLLFITLAASSIVGQSYEEWKKKEQQKFTEYKADKEKEYQEFRERVNKEYAELMRQQWEFFNSKEAIPTPKKPKPTAPIVAKPKLRPISKPIIIDRDIQRPTPPADTVPPIPIVEIPSNNKHKDPLFKFSYYGTNCSVRLAEDLRFHLYSVTENDIADKWITLSSEKYNNLLFDCLKLKKELNLCDWGYYKLLEALTNSFFGMEYANEAELLKIYLMSQSGYKVRIARSGETLVTLLPFVETVFKYQYVNIENEKYYVMNRNKNNNSFYIFNKSFPQEISVSLHSNKKPKLEYAELSPKSFTSPKLGNTTIDISLNSNLLKFCSEFPGCSWDVYSSRSLSDKTKQELYPTLSKTIKGMNEKDAANVILNFVQKAFEYKTDGEQFGYERPLFGEETLFFPYSDCEDRSILFSILIKDLLGLDVVLLNYPEHLATAVKFNQNIKGDYMFIGRDKYVVCDPTYIGAPVGKAMPHLKNTSAKVIEINY